MKETTSIPSGKIVHNKDKIKIKDYDSFVLGGDIGGTHSNFSVAGIKEDKPELLVTTHFLNRGSVSVTEALKQTMRYSEHLGLKTERACFGVAGPVSSDGETCALSNIDMKVSKKEILKKTVLKHVLLINDFTAIGYGIGLLDIKNKKDIIKIRDKKNSANLNKAVIGAGTGLGKTYLVFNDVRQSLIPQQSEGGWSDFPYEGQRETECMEFIKKHQKLERVACDDVVSGRGLESLFLYLRSTGEFKETGYTDDILNSLDKPAMISKYKDKDRLCKESFSLFSKFYGRVAKNFCLETLAKGGLYIAGGIASKNPDIFKSGDFLKEFENSEKMRRLLEEIPIYIVVNYDVSLKGACLAAHEMKDTF